MTSLTASDPRALYTVKASALGIVCAALDAALWDTGRLGDSFQRRLVYHDRTPWDCPGQISVYPSRVFVGQHGAEQIQTVNATDGATGFHTVDLTVEAVTCIATLDGTSVPDVDTLEADTQFIDAIGWCMFVALLKAQQAGALTPLTPSGRVLIGPLAPGGARGGCAAVTLGISMQL